MAIFTTFSKKMIMPGSHGKGLENSLQTNLNSVVENSACQCAVYSTLIQTEGSESLPP